MPQCLQEGRHSYGLGAEGSWTQGASLFLSFLSAQLGRVAMDLAARLDRLDERFLEQQEWQKAMERGRSLHRSHFLLPFLSCGIFIGLRYGRCVPHIARQRLIRGFERSVQSLSHLERSIQSLSSSIRDMQQSLKEDKVVVPGENSSLIRPSVS